MPGQQQLQTVLPIPGIMLGMIGFSHASFLNAKQHVLRDGALLLERKIERGLVPGLTGIVAVANEEIPVVTEKYRMGPSPRKIQDQRAMILFGAFLAEEGRHGAIDACYRLGARCTQRRSHVDDVDAGEIALARQPTMEPVDLPIPGDAPMGDAVSVDGLPDHALRVASPGSNLIRSKTFDGFKRSMKPEIGRENVVHVVDDPAPLEHAGIFEQKSIARQQASPAHLLIVRFQDVSGGVVVKVLSEAYIRARNIEDKLRCAEIKFIAYAVSFFGEAVVGMIRQNGVPYINIPVAMAMTKEFVQFCVIDAAETHRLYRTTAQIIRTDEELIAEHERLDQLVPKYVSAEECFEALNRAEENIDRLAELFGEEEV